MRFILSSVLAARSSFPSLHHATTTAVVSPRWMTSTRRGIASLTPHAIVSRSRRALFYVPGSDERKLKKSQSVGADCVVFDLEDSVSLNKKSTARYMVYDALEDSKMENSEKAVRINAVGTGLELDDLNAILSSKQLEAIVIPKVQSANDVHFVARMIDAVSLESRREKIRLIASVESALGIMNIQEIATADPRMDALIFAAEDYCADLGLIRTRSRKEMLFARQMIVNAASAYGLQSLDLVCVDFKDPEVLKDECKEGHEFGFSGKQAIHPAQIDTIQEMFLPEPKDLERAVKILQGFEHYTAKGVGAFQLDGKMIDMPVVKWADKVVSKAKAGGMEIPKPELDVNSGGEK